MAVALVIHGSVTHCLTFDDASQLVALSHILICEAMMKISLSAHSKLKQEKKNKRIKRRLSYVSNYSCGLTPT